MTLFSKLLTLLRLKREPSIADITKPMASIVKRLELHAASKNEAAEASRVRATEKRAEADKDDLAAQDHASEAGAANALAQRYATLTLAA